jgi:hypothetical protein
LFWSPLKEIGGILSDTVGLLAAQESGTLDSQGEGLA